MNNIEERDYYNNLLDIYGELLSKKQKTILYEAFSLDISYSELAIEYNVSRSAINDAIQKGKDKLDKFEKDLKIYENSVKTLEITAKLKEDNEDLKDNQLIDEIERMNKHGI
ncbi:MAG: hypothetical protein LUB56_00275 [Coprobacillus sp.]|nr:hypothetical protein [Coprobacillus sp.]